jgi:hypothetical protein
MPRALERKLRAAVVVAAAWMAACRAAPSPVPPVPGKGGPVWSELTSPHFTVWTDADRAQVRDLVRKLERLHQVVVGTVFPTAPADGRVLAIVLRDDRELRAFSTTRQARPFAREPQPPLWQPLIVVSATAPPGDLEVALAHELVHAISFGVIRHQPRWFGEGMATYFQSVGLDLGRATARVGGVPAGPPLRVAQLLPISELFEWASASTDETRQYLTAWALFCFLSNQHGAELGRYMQLLATADREIERRSDRARRIWDQAFPSLPVTTVDRQLHDWWLHGTHDEQQFRFKPQDGAITERRLGDADVYAVRAVLRSAEGTRDDRVRADVAAALASEPTNVLAWLMSAALDHRPITADDARPIVDAHDGDWRAWLLLATAVEDVPGELDVPAARTRACALIAANPALLPPPGLCPPHPPGPASP